MHVAHPARPSTRCRRSRRRVTDDGRHVDLGVRRCVPTSRGDGRDVGRRSARGRPGPTVQAVQQKLIDFGYYVAGGADGHFGPGTTAALRVFQQQNGLNPTGVVTENTARYLGLAAGVPATGGGGAAGR